MSFFYTFYVVACWLTEFSVYTFVMPTRTPKRKRITGTSSTAIVHRLQVPPTGYRTKS